MATHNPANTAALSATQPSMEVLVAADADAVVGGQIICHPPDFRIKWCQWLGTKPVKTVVNAAKKVADWIGDLF
jgi:hypothetical protein